MTKKDYILIASAINAEWKKECSMDVLNTAIAISKALETDNPKFNSDRFYQACMTLTA